MKNWLFGLIVATVLSTSLRDSRADEIYSFVVKKQETKALKKWSLQEWLDARDRIKLMDMWLSFNSPSPYEFFISGALRFGELSSGGRYTGADFQAAAYATIVGLGYERETGLGTRQNALFHLRVFGYHYQGTHLRFELGLRQEEVASGLKFRNPVAGVGLTFYVTRFFGFEGLYRHAFAATPSAANLSFISNRYDAGAFIDFSFLRVFGKYVREVSSTEASNLLDNSTRSGSQVGLALFF